MKSMRMAVCKVIDSYPDGYRFYGNKLHSDVTGLFPEARYKYTDTILRTARKYRRAAFKVIDQKHSLYEKTAPEKSMLEKLLEARKAWELKHPPKPEINTGQLYLFEGMQ